MIILKAGGEIIPVTSAARVTLVRTNPLFEDDIIRGEYTYPFDIPWNDTAKRIIGRVDLPESRSAFSNPIDAELEIGGVFRVTGKLRIIRIKNDIASVCVNGGISIITDTKIRDLVTDEITLTTDLKYLDLYISNGAIPLGTNITIKSNGISYTAQYNGDKVATLDAIANAINADSANAGCTASRSTVGAFEVIRLTQTGTGCENWFNSNGADDDPYIDYMAPNGHREWFNAYISDFESELNDAANANSSTYKWTVFPVKNSVFYGDTNADYGGYINYYNVNNSPYNFYTNGDLLNNKYTWVPYVYLKTVLDAIFATFPFDVESTFLEITEIKNAVFYNNVALDCLDYSDTVPTGLNIGKNKFLLADHLPDWNISDLLLGLKSLFNLQFDFDLKNNILHIEKGIDPINTKEEIDITDKVLHNWEVEPVIEPGFTLQLTVDENDEAIKTIPAFFEDYVTGDGSKTIRTIFGSLVYFDGVDAIDGTREWYVPWEETTGSSDEFGLGHHDFGGKLLFYHGLYPDSNNDDYPLAASDSIDADGNDIGDHALYWTGTQGLWVMCWQDWIEAISETKRYTRFARLTPSDLKNWSFQKKVRIGHTLYICRELRVSASLRGLKPAELDLYKL